MPVQTFDKKYIATTQLETALRLYFEGYDYFSAITLAGAAEEILGRLVADSGRDSSIESLKKSGMRIYRGLFGTESTPKRIAHAANLARNAMKHHDATPGPTIRFDPKKNAEDMLERAIENYDLLDEQLTADMERFWRAIA